MVVLARRTPLTKKQLTILRTHILRKRRKAQEVEAEADEGKKTPDEFQQEQSKDVEGKMGEKEESPSSEGDADQQPSQSDKNDRPKEQEAETADDISKQIEVQQSRLDSLREEKHRLFQQLKMVLHEEDEKRQKEQEHLKQQEMEKAALSAEMTVDPRLSQISGIKRSLPTSPTGATGGLGPPPVKQHRGPLLPTPDSYLRRGAHYRYPSASESGPRQHYMPRGHTLTGQRPAYHERYSHLHTVPHDIHMQAPHGSHDPHMMPRPQLGPQNPHSIGYTPPHLQMQPQYPAMQMAGFPYQPSPSPYGSMTNLQSPQSSQPPVQMSMQYPQQGYMQPHPSEMQMQGQPHLHEVHPQHAFTQMQGQPHAHDIHMQAHHEMPHYIVQSQMMPGQGFADYSQGGAVYAHLHDPRHQKLMMEHQRSSSSPMPLQSPSHSSKQPPGGSGPFSPQEGAAAQSGLVGSPSQSPAHISGGREHRYSKK